MAVEELNLVKLKAKFAKQKVAHISRESFIHAATMRVLRVASKYLSDDVHYSEVRRIISAWLDATGISDSDVDFDPFEVGEELGRIIVDGAKKRALAYQSTKRPEAITFPDYKISIVTSSAEGGEPPAPTIDQIPVVSKETFIPGMMVAGVDGHRWSNSLHPAYAFDSWPEVRVGWLLDHDAATRSCRYKSTGSRRGSPQGRRVSAP